MKTQKIGEYLERYPALKKYCGDSVIQNMLQNSTIKHQFKRVIERLTYFSFKDPTRKEAFKAVCLELSYINSEGTTFCLQKNQEDLLQAGEDDVSKKIIHLVMGEMLTAGLCNLIFSDKQRELGDMKFSHPLALTALMECFPDWWSEPNSQGYLP